MNKKGTDFHSIEPYSDQQVSEEIKSLILDKKFFTDNAKTLLIALLIAIFIRSLFFQPFYIPSSSMEPNLLVGDRLFVSKYTYGYSKHSFPFSPNLFSGRILYDQPKRGDVIVFKTPVDNRTDYICLLYTSPSPRDRG